MAAVAGVRGTGDWGTDERPKDFRNYILWRNPNGSTPITGLMGKGGKEITKDPEFSWWDEPVDLVRLQVNVAVTLTATDTLITVDSVDTSASDPDKGWGVAKHLVPGDILMVEPAADAASFTPEYVQVTAVSSDTQFSVNRGVSGSTASTIANDTWLLKISTSFAEGTSSPSSASRNPVKYSNYTQIFKTAYSVTGTAAETELRTGDVLKNERKRKSFDHARDQELAFLFGRQYETTGTNGKPLRYMDGIRRRIPSKTTTIFTGAVSMTGTTNNFLDAVYKTFDFETEAGDERLCICGNQFLNELNKMIAKDGNTQIQYAGEVKMYGMTLTSITIPQGKLYFKTHPLLNRHSLYTKSSWILDFSAIKARPMRNRDTKFKDNIQDEGDDSIEGQWLTEIGIEVRYGGLTCGYLGNMTAS